MTTRITEDILLGLMQLGMNDQSVLANVRQVVQSELAKYDIRTKETAIAIRDNSDVDMVTRFFVAKTSAGLSARSLKMYSTTLHRLLKKLNRNLKQVTTDDIRVLLTNMRMEGIELVSIDNDRRVLSSFFGWLYAEGFIKDNPMKRIEKVKYQKKVKKPFTEEEMEMLRLSAKTDRDRAIIEFLYSTGCRVTEAEQLNRTDIDFSLRECTVLGKGNKERRVFLSPRCAAVMQVYLKSRKDKDPALFVSPFSWVKNDEGKMVRVDKVTRLLKSGIENVVKQAGKRAGIANAHPHRLRRTCATFALRRGMPIEQVCKMLGHASIETTTIYANSTMDEVKASHEKYLT
jgi:site-specific recombinase XerD